MEKLILKKAKEWGPAKSAIWLPEDLANSIREIAEETNMSTKTLAAELISFAMEHIEIVEQRVLSVTTTELNREVEVYKVNECVNIEALANEFLRWVKDNNLSLCKEEEDLNLNEYQNRARFLKIVNR